MRTSASALLEERAGARRPHGGGVGLAEDGLKGLAGHCPVAPRGQQGADVAPEVHDAALPAGARQALGDGAYEPGVGVADDEAHTGEPVLAQPAQEPEPARVGSVSMAATPSMRRTPSEPTPMAVTTAVDCARPSLLHLTYVTSGNR